MTHDSEKSDLSILARKSANKTRQLRAESMERRERTKENTGRSPTNRTQSRDFVTGRLDRVRQVAARNKKERFTALLHHVDTELL